MICIECTNPEIDCLFFKYKSDYIKLTICSKCGKVADKYIEYDNVILFIDILLLKPQAYRHLAYNLTEIELLKDEVVHKEFNGNSINSPINKIKGFISRYKKLTRLITMMILFEVYLTWAYEEKKLNHSMIMDFILKQEIYKQYSFFIIKSIIEQFIVIISIQYLFKFWLGWGSIRNKNLNENFQNGYYNSVLLTTTLVSSSIKLFPILMLIWPYDKTSISWSIIILIGFLNTIEALKIVTNFSYGPILIVLVISVFNQFIISKIALGLVISYSSNLSLEAILWNEFYGLINSIENYKELIYTLKDNVNN